MRAHLTPEALGVFLAKDVLMHELHENCSAADLQVLVPQYLCQVLYNSGRALENYFGEEISQAEHGAQCAKFAMENDARDEDTILAALLHDVGHLLSNAPQMPGNLGTVAHERVGASFLAELGFSSKTCSLVRRHVDAKRYLTSVDKNYLAKLSPSSLATLREQGGPMSADEARDFAERDVLFHPILALRRWDEAAKVRNMANTPAWSDVFQAMMTRAIQREQFAKQGFVLLRHVLSPQAKENLVRWAGEIQNWDAKERGKWMIYYETVAGKETLCRTENILPYHE